MKKLLKILPLAALFLVSATNAYAVEFSLFAAVIDTEDLQEAYGGGLRIAFPITPALHIDVTGTYFESARNTLRGVDQVAQLSVGIIPIDLGVTSFLRDDGGFLFGFGLTWAILDDNDLEIANGNRFNDGNASDEIGWYAKLGYAARRGFFAELLYRDLEASIQYAELVNRLDVDLTSYQLNLGFRFGGRR